ncbi:MAG: hypothetical protein OEZ36_04540 [Spirochaetota bacterium]|nr:hypothetical protein [Spirochaetota bacterium]
MKNMTTFLAMIIILNTLTLNLDARNSQNPAVFEKTQATDKICEKKDKPRQLTYDEIKSLSIHDKQFAGDKPLERDAFEVTLKGYGRVLFYCNGVQFLLIKDNKLLYKSRPGPLVFEGFTFGFLEIEAISFFDLNGDGFEDISIITNQRRAYGRLETAYQTASYLFISDKKKGFYLLDNKHHKLWPIEAVLKYARKRFRK